MRAQVIYSFLVVIFASSAPAQQSEPRCGGRGPTFWSVPFRLEEPGDFQTGIPRASLRKLYDERAVAITPEVEIDCPDFGTDWWGANPSPIWLSNRNVLVVWAGWSPPARGQTIGMTVLNDEGERVSECSILSDMCLSIEHDHCEFGDVRLCRSGGNIVAVWEGCFHCGSGDPWLVWFQILDESLNRLGQAQSVPLPELSYGTGIKDVAGSSSGRLVIVAEEGWPFGDPSFDTYRLPCVLLYDKEGTLLARIYPEPRFQPGWHLPEEVPEWPPPGRLFHVCGVACDAEGNFVVVWSAPDGPAEYNWFEGVYARMYRADGTPRTDAFLVNQDTLWDQDTPQVAMDSKGNFIIVWREGGLKAQRFLPDGTRYGREFFLDIWPWGASVFWPLYDIEMNDSGRIVLTFRHDLIRTSYGVVRVFDFWAVPFIRGDANFDGSVDLADVVTILRYLFRGGKEPEALDAADVNDSGSVNLSDPVYLVMHLFSGMPEKLPLPYPYWGIDRTGDTLGE